MLNVAELAQYIQAGGAQIPADMVIENGTLVNVMTREYYQADVAVYQGRIVAVDADVSAYVGPATQHIDATGQYLVPGLIDGHLHVECSKLSMTSFAMAAVPHGTTSIISGLDEYIAVSGIDGVQEVHAEIEKLPLRTFWAAPYKTPYTMPQSTIAYNINADVQAQLQADPTCYGVWETVREAVEIQDPDTLQTLLHAQANHRPIFGCAPMATGIKLNQFLMSGVRLDHESYDHIELVEKIRKGMQVLIRESSVTHFLAENIRAITEVNPNLARHISFCTDDVTVHDLMTKGHLDHVVRLAIQAGVDPMTAIQMATINSAEAYRIDDQVGVIAPGRLADILLIDSPTQFNVQTVISKGAVVAENQAMLEILVPPVRSAFLTGKLKHDPVVAPDFQYGVPLAEGQATVRTIKTVGPFVRQAADVELPVIDGVVRLDPEQDVAMVSVIERFGKNGNQSLGFTSGWGLKAGAIATSASPDDNNLVVMGVNHADMAIATNYLIEHGGGQVVVLDGEVIAELQLPIGGITTDARPEVVAEQEAALLAACRRLGSTVPDPIFYLSFLPITAIPDLAITDLGCVDCTSLALFDPILALNASEHNMI